MFQWGDSSVWDNGEAHDLKVLGHLSRLGLHSQKSYPSVHLSGVSSSHGLEQVGALPGSLSNLRLQTRRLLVPAGSAAARACGLTALFHHAPGGPRAASVAALRTA